MGLPDIDSDGLMQRQIQELVEIGVALSSELNLDVLLEKALYSARRLTRANAGTLYIYENDTLVFKILHNEQLGVYQGGTTGTEVSLPPVSMNPLNVSARAALEKKTFRIADVYDSREFDFSGPRIYDKETGYRSQSMLVVPMLNHKQEVLGVLQLINAQDPETGAVVEFSDEAVGLTQAFASQAGVAISNASLIKETQNLLDAVITVLATSIDQKSPYTGNHVQRVAEFNQYIAEVINNKTDGPFADVHFPPEELETIRMAGWLHDVGKVTTPEWIMDKATKLQEVFDRIALIEQRFATIARGVENRALTQKIELIQSGAAPEALQAIDEKTKTELQALEDDLAFIRGCNSPREFLPDDRVERLRAIAAQTYEWNGQTLPRLTESELENLSVRKGSLTDTQFNIMRRHVVLTRRLLRQVPFPKRLENVPLYASHHHEKLNGRGYPDGLTAEDLPLPSRILAVADIYEALSAKDRPYKKAFSKEKMLEILTAAANHGEIDADIARLLVEDKIHEDFERDYSKKANRSSGGSLTV